MSAFGGKADVAADDLEGDAMRLLGDGAGAIATAQSLTGRSHDVRHSNRRSDGGDNDNKGGK